MTGVEVGSWLWTVHQLKPIKNTVWEYLLAGTGYYVYDRYIVRDGLSIWNILHINPVHNDLKVNTMFSNSTNASDAIQHNEL